MREDTAAEKERRSAGILETGTVRENGRKPERQAYPPQVTSESLRSRMKKKKKGEILEVDFHE